MSRRRRTIATCGEAGLEHHRSLPVHPCVRAAPRGGGRGSSRSARGGRLPAPRTRGRVADPRGRRCRGPLRRPAWAPAGGGGCRRAHAARPRPGRGDRRARPSDRLGAVGVRAGGPRLDAPPARPRPLRRADGARLRLRRRRGARAGGAAPGERRPGRAAHPSGAAHAPASGCRRAARSGRVLARTRSLDVRAGRNPRGGRRRHQRGRTGRARERPRAARRRDGRRRLERPLRAPGRPDAAGRDGGQPASGRALSRRRPRGARTVVRRRAPRAPRCRPAARPPPARDHRAERPGRRPARAATRRARARRRPLGRRCTRFRAHRRARRARGRRDRDRPLRRLLDGLVHRRDGGRRAGRPATFATAATRSSYGARRSTTTRSRGSR